jgi:hypothetical protein
VHRIRGSEKSVVEGTRSAPGVKLSQSGLWDDTIVCEKHEKAFSTADDYMARFVRKFEKAAALSSTGKSYETPNPKPELLLRFAAGTVWRHAVSQHGTAHGLSLGPYRAVIESHLFGEDLLTLELLLGRSNLVDPSGNRIEIGLAPYRRKLLWWNIWHFSIAGFDFYLKADKRPFPELWKPFLANDNDPVTVPLIDPLRFDQLPMFQPIFKQMTAPMASPRLQRR